MYKIIRKKSLNPTVTQMEIEAPLVAKKAKPGQFIILRVDEEGERIPLTVAGTDSEEGTVKIIFQIVGATTELLNHKQQGEYIQDFAGPLGKATETEGIRKVCGSVSHVRRTLRREGSAYEVRRASHGRRAYPPGGKYRGFPKEAE